jgi:uncharacterized protein YndB with AHSA1/START domain
MTNQGNFLKVEVVVKKPLKKVWAFYTETKHIKGWNFATDDWHCPEATSDFKVGGKFSYRMEAKDGSFAFDFEGTFDEIKEKEKLVYTISDGRKVEVIFEELLNETKVKINFEAENMNSVDLQKSGWQAILNNFKNYVETK